MYSLWREERRHWSERDAPWHTGSWVWGSVRGTIQVKFSEEWHWRKELNSSRNISPGGPMIAGRSEEASMVGALWWRDRVVRTGVGEVGRGQVKQGPTQHGHEFRLLLSCDEKPLESFKQGNSTLWFIPRALSWWHLKFWSLWTLCFLNNTHTKYAKEELKVVL